ncbi:putative mannosyltransferase ktr4 [Ophidiomyces ophidiicola]|nr:putative mannosyltransferase ktr4 [Ophidiomyces ophidiicola]KAI1992023.1 putative mannosyltransferase ktr4 [Ophidiomyces ophidiicola]KAI1998315.1 putative mannosyltransferase ktr4 [Ophidiomyces ophidiicola]KAI2000883.1 putative mannosyltransferase ktr4 [Ophidiomyces ophidiicola]
MAIARPLRILLAGGILLTLFLFYNLSKSPRSLVKLVDRYDNGLKHDPLADPTGEPEGHLWRATGDAYAPDNPNSSRINATLLSLVRNEELDQLIMTMKELERTWNSKFNYPWTFFNDQPFSDEFKKRTQAETKAKCNYELVPKEHWDAPDWISMDLYSASVDLLKEKNVQYSGKISYNKMCRWNSGMFYRHPALANAQYYWRVEPNVHFFCDVDYDVFRYMQDNNKTYGFTINLYDSPESIESLWPETVKFIAAHPEYLHTNNAMNWLVDGKQRPIHNQKANGYSTCHFWSNFEIGDLSFFRGKAYEEYFNHLDRAGGFFYERWGDAPVHSIGLGLFEDKNKIHWYVFQGHSTSFQKTVSHYTLLRFRDIGYNHIPYYNCPNSPKCKGCTPAQFYAGEEFLRLEDCRPNWFKYVGTG